ncbi:MAG: hypothetical protein AAGA56_26850 [Myxococcota bacterium]
MVAVAVVCLTLIALATPADIAAHELETNAATIHLRDGNITIRLRANAAALLDAVTIVGGTHLRIDGTDVPLVLRRAPQRDELVAAMAGSAIETDLRGHPHPPRFTAELESASPGWSGEQLEVRFPPELGSVLVTFAQPQTRRVDAGSAAQLAILRPPSSGAELPKPPPTEPSSRAWAWALLLLTVGVAAAVIRRRTLAAEADP